MTETIAAQIPLALAGAADGVGRNPNPAWPG